MNKFLNGLIIYISTITIVILLISILEETSIFKKHSKSNIQFLQENSEWADSVLSKMSLDEKIAQLLIFKIENDSFPEDSIDFLISKNISGIFFTKNNYENNLRLSSYFQHQSKFPSLISILDSTQSPDFLVLESVKDSTLISDYYNQTAENMSAQGVNFTSVFDLNTCITNVYLKKIFNDSINRKTAIRNIINSYNSNNNKYILAAFENFYKYYNFEADSLNFRDSILFFEKFICLEGLPAIIFSKNILRDTLSQVLKENHLKDYMEKYLGFYGLLVSEKLITGNNQMSLDETVRAGIDLIIIENSLENVISEIKNLIATEVLKVEELDIRVKKILMAKKWMNLQLIDSLQIENLVYENKNPVKQLALQKVFENSIVLVKNSNSIIPFSNLKTKNFITVVIGEDKMPDLIENMQYYTTINEDYIANVSDFKAAKYSGYSNIIIVLNSIQTDTIADSLFFNEIKILDKFKNVILVNFRQPTNLENFQDIETLIQIFDNHILMQKALGQYLFGGFFSDAELPVSISENFPKGTHAEFTKIKRYKYTIPEDSEMNSEKLSAIDSIVNNGIENQAYPGCVVLVAKDNKVVYYKAFGKQTYNDFRPVLRTDIFDLASITKVAATTLMMMNLYEKGEYNLDDSIKYFLEDTINLTFKNHQIRDFLIHQTGIPANMPVGEYIISRNDSSALAKKFFSAKKDSVHNMEIAEDLWFNNSYIDSIYWQIFNCEIDITKPYLYSDANFNILYKVFTQFITSSFDKYLYNNFYSQLGLQTIGFHPLDRFNESRIMPTQNDKYWRKQILRGYVHDESAALNGGMWGNAGLFSNANDLAVLFQMLLNGGIYGGVRLFNSTTVDLFTSIQEGSQRGLGFNLNDYGSFGHTGFTGTCVWASKKYNVVYVFLSNRVHPMMTNNKLQEMEIRQKIYDVIISSID